MIPAGVPSSFKLAEIIRDVREKRYPTVQHMATAHGQGERWAKQVFKAAKERRLLPHDMTHREWLDLFPVTRRLTQEEVEDQKKRRAEIRVFEAAILHREREEEKTGSLNRTISQRAVNEWRACYAPPAVLQEGDIYWHRIRSFADLTLDFILAKYKFDDLNDEKKRVVKEKLADRQKGVCMICRKPFSTDRVPCLDHGHETGKIRGLLCTFCNMALGGFQDSIMSLENAIKYLLEHATISLHGNA